MGLSVVADKPFLGEYAVQHGPVLVVDLENGVGDIRDLCERLAQYLGLPTLPDDLLLWSYGTAGPTDTASPQKLEEMVQSYVPKLVIIDSLRAFDATAEEKNANAATLLKGLHRIAKRYGTSFLLIHHIKKPGENGVPALEDVTAMAWLLQACGARALVNQTDCRIGLDATRGTGAVLEELNSRRPSASKPGEEVALVMKGFARLRGEFGPVFLTRDFDEDGEALGYRVLKGLEHLSSELQHVYHRLPDEFTLKTAEASYGRGAQATLNFLQKCIRAGGLRKVGHRRNARYLKVTPGTVE
jgi:hypothetical protein